MPDVVLAHVPLEHVLVLGGVLFAIGLYVALSKRNAVGVLMGVELMLNAVNVTLLAFSRFIVIAAPAGRPGVRGLRDHGGGGRGGRGARAGRRRIQAPRHGQHR